MIKSSIYINLFKRLALVLIGMCLSTIGSSAACLNYGLQYALDGVLTVEQAVPFENNDPFSYPVLELDLPICMDADPIAIENPALSDVLRIQVIPPFGEVVGYEHLIGQRVTVNGDLLAAISRQHMQPLVMDAQHINALTTAAATFPAFWTIFYHAALGGNCKRLSELAVVPMPTYGSLDSDPIQMLDTSDIVAACPRLLELEHGPISNVGAIPPPDWRTAAPYDDQARLGNFEFTFDDKGWHWTGYYGQTS